MNPKIGLTATALPKNGVKNYYTMRKRTLQRNRQNVLIFFIYLVLVLMPLFMIITSVHAQERPAANGPQPPAGLSVGDKVPDVAIPKIINYKMSAAKFSDFKGKLVILDFWATSCGTCIAMLPKVDMLQKQFKRDVVILPVTYEKEAKVRSSLAAKRNLKGLKISSVVEDVSLKKLFPHPSIPHVAWIDGDGTVLSITNGEYVNEANIEAALAGKPLTWLQKPKGDYDYDKPLAGITPPGALYSMLSGSVQDAAFRSRRVALDETRDRLYKINYSILHLYAIAYGRGDLVFAGNRRSLTVKDSSAYIYDPEMGYYDAWMLRNGYSYEAVVPRDMPMREVNERMRQDLDRYLNLETGIEERKVACLVLRRLPGAGPRASVKKREIYLGIQDKKPFMHHSGLGNLIYALNKVPGMPPVLDESNYDKPVDLDFDKPISDIDAVNRVLRSQGLQLVNDTKELEMFILREKEPRGPKSTLPKTDQQ